jgi:ankyrin repeat protein
MDAPDESSHVDPSSPQTVVADLFLKALSILTANGVLDAKDLLSAASVCRAARCDVATWERLVRMCHGPNKLTVLMVTASSGNVDGVRWLVQTCKADVDAESAIGTTALFFAAQRGHATVVTTLIDLHLHAGLDSKSERAWTALHYATDGGHLSATRALLAAGADPCAANKDGLHPISCADGDSAEEITLELLNYGADWSNCTQLGWNALHYAAANGWWSVFCRLLEAEADINVTGTEGATPLNLSAFYGMEKIALKLLELGADTACTFTSDDHEHGWTCLHAACYGGCESVVSKLLDKELDIQATSRDGSSPLHIAAGQGHEEVVVVLLRRGAAVDAQDNENATALMRASAAGHERVVSLLLGAKASLRDSNKAGMNALHLAAWNGKKGVVEILLRHDSRRNTLIGNSNTPLTLAAQRGHFDVVQALIDAKADVDLSNPLRLAMKYGERDVVLALLKAGAQVTNETVGSSVDSPQAEIMDMLLEAQAADMLAAACGGGRLAAVERLLVRSSLTPTMMARQPLLLHLACESPHKGVEKCLLQHGHSPNVADEHGQSPLHRASQKDYDGTVTLLLENGADKDAVDNEGRTPLFLAAQHDAYWAALALLRYGADIEKPAKDGRSPLLAALAHGHPYLINLLVCHNASIEKARFLLHNSRSLDTFPQESLEALIFQLVDRRQLLPPGRKGCNPELQVIVDEALEGFASRLSEPGVDARDRNIPPFRQLIRWFLGAPCAEQPEVALPALPAVATPPVDKKPEEYRAERLDALQQDAWERRMPLVAFFDGAKKAAVAGKAKEQAT